MDYDVTKMPEGYDRGRSLSTGVLDEWLALLERQLGNDAVRNIVDLGCGTGRFSDALARHFRADLIGVDPSSKMLAEAEKKPRSERVRYVSGRGEALPVE